jgi:hypothetical protein
MHLKHLVEMPGDSEFLRESASRSETHAEAVAESLTSRAPGFWEIACEMFERFPEGEGLRDRLVTAVA